MTDAESIIPESLNKASVNQALTNHAISALWSLSPTNARLELLNAGYTPIPLVEGRKVPPKDFPYNEYKTGQLTVTPDTIHQWERDYPRATNTGVLCGPQFGLLVVDTDSESARNYFVADGVPYPPVIASTRGQHFYFRCPPDIAGEWCGTAAILPDIDIKARGYVLVPPSIHPSGAAYEEVIPLSTPLATAPAWLLKLLRARMAPAPTVPPQRPHSAPTGDTSATEPLHAHIEAALGATAFNAAGWSNNVPCPFHDDHHASATWTRKGGGALYCHAGCTPGPEHVSNGKRAFGALDTARALGIPLPRLQSTPALPTGSLGCGTATADRAFTFENEGGESTGNYLHFCPPYCTYVLVRQICK